MYVMDDHTDVILLFFFLVGFRLASWAEIGF